MLHKALGGCQLVDVNPIKTYSWEYWQSFAGSGFSFFGTCTCFQRIAAPLQPRLHCLSFQGGSDDRWWQVMTGGVCQVGSNHPGMDDIILIILMLKDWVGASPNQLRQKPAIVSKKEQKRESEHSGICHQHDMFCVLVKVRQKTKVHFQLTSRLRFKMYTPSQPWLHP